MYCSIMLSSVLPEMMKSEDFFTEPGGQGDVPPLQGEGTASLMGDRG